MLSYVLTLCSTSGLIYLPYPIVVGDEMCFLV